MSDHGYTTHGHSLPGKTQHLENRPPVARCGGPIICKQCSQEVAEAFKQMFKPTPSDATEDHVQDLGDFPDIEIQCDEETEIAPGQWEDCEQKATHMAVLRHFDGYCEPQTVALCEGHVIAVSHNLKALQTNVGKINIEHGHFAECRFCNQPLASAEDIGTITEL